VYKAELQPVTVDSCDGTCDGSWGAVVEVDVSVGKLVDGDGVAYISAKLGLALSIFPLVGILVKFLVALGEGLSGSLKDRDGV